ncbi:hypothetical protein Nepgr_029443 [Nepenthes gracilis]|uniref:Uncharacterized protein n=1 Tax=Nepenthes gracilis TaxID=150966 RepID=A0AAD3Y4U8_NEPGR|nr:hypothetical protein Nepgr_029443 [Nepenthes gracilis]
MNLSKATISTVATQIEMIGKEDIPINPKDITSKGPPSESGKTPTSRKKERKAITTNPSKRRSIGFCRHSILKRPDRSNAFFASTVYNI